jgi:hypothetical protein
MGSGKSKDKKNEKMDNPGMKKDNPGVVKPQPNDLSLTFMFLGTCCSIYFPT